MPTAETFLSRGQKIALAVMALLAVACGVVFGPTALLRVTAIGITLFYLVFVGIKLIVFWAGAGYRFPQVTLPDSDDPSLPTYTILVPMHGEGERGFHKLVAALQRLRYRTDKLQVLLVLEETDVDTVMMVKRQNLPSHFQVIVVPNVGPTTKPKACNYAMYWARGERTVIFDFEDRPEPDHLLKAVAGLDAAHADDRRVVCVQGALQFWNTRGGLATSYYWGEYVVHFRWMLTGMARLGWIPPLGGTSNHFFTGALLRVAQQYGELRFEHASGEIITMPNVWDAFNVTEDADLAARLARLGFRIAVIDAVTFEEAPHSLGKARKQRSRWLKGYIQTLLSLTRGVPSAMRTVGPVRYAVFCLFIGGTPLSLILNPIVWSTTLTYVVSRLAGWPAVSLYIESLFPGPVYYIAMVLAVGGNFAMWFQKLVTPLRQQEHESFQQLSPEMRDQQFGLSFRLLCTPFWWLFTSLSAYLAVWELLWPSKRFYWSKTAHGHAVNEEDAILGIDPAASQHPAVTAGDMPTVQLKALSSGDAPTVQFTRYEPEQHRNM